MARRRPAPQTMSISNGDGPELDMAIRRPADATQVAVRTIGPIGAYVFPDCPICGDPATSDEHVPPAAIGGQVTTRTCEPCNNRLGSLVEPDLIDWVDGAVGRVSFTGPGARGPRYARRVLHRTTTAGEMVLVVDGKYDERVRDLLNTGDVELTATAPDPNRLRLAALKHAYLSACVHLRAIPPETDQVRAELIAARDAAHRDHVAYSPMAAGIELLRIDPDGDPGPGHPLLHATATIDGEVEQGALLGGKVFVSWSSTPIPEPSTQPPARFSATMQIGGRTDGTVTRVDGNPEPPG